MPVTLSTMISNIRSQILEPTTHKWTDAEITRWINECLSDIARRAEVLKTYTDVSGVINQQEYTLPSTTLRVHRVEWTPTGGSTYNLEYRDFNSMDSVWWSQSRTWKGDPHWFTLWGYPPSLKLVAYPIPSQAGTFRVYYYTSPTKLVSPTDNAVNLSVPEGWDDLVVWYADYLARRALRDPRWEEAKKHYEEKVLDMIDLTRRWTDQSDSIQVGTSGNYLPGWLYADW